MGDGERCWREARRPRGVKSICCYYDDTALEPGDEGQRTSSGFTYNVPIEERDKTGADQPPGSKGRQGSQKRLCEAR